MDVEKSLPAKDRCLLTYEILSRTNYAREVDDIFNPTVELTPKEASRIGIERLLANGTFQAAYPLHEVFDFPLLSNASKNILISYSITFYLY